MGNFVKQAARRAIALAGYIIARQQTFDDLAKQAEIVNRLLLFAPLFSDERQQTIDAIFHSQSQLGQDIFVLEQCGWKRDGWFVEFGATDGRTLSNSWLLEKQFGWTGILAEPAHCWHESLLASGRQAAIETDCIWSRSGETLTFHETDFAELSTIGDFAAGDDHDRSRARGYREYNVRTISLNDMLQKHNAPAEMDYLSIDTEGSEFDILSALDFGRYRFRVITCEHNFTPNRERIHTLLSSHGYTRKFEELSDFDDWYVLET